MNSEIRSYFPSVFSDLAPKHVCLYQCKHLGDCVLTLPLIHRILDSLPLDGTLSLITQPSAIEIFSGIDSRLDIYALPKSFIDWIQLVKNLSRVELTFLPHASSRGLILGKVVGSSCVGDSSLRALRFFKPEYQVPLRLVPWRHTAEQYLDLARRVGLEVATKYQSISLDGLISNPLSALVSERLPEEAYITIQSGSRWFFKSPAETFWLEVIHLLERKGISVVLTGSDQGAEGELLEFLSSRSNAISLAGLTAISDLAHVIARGSRYLGVDTLASHLSAGTGTPGLVLFGPTSEKIWGPYGHSARTKPYANSYACRPCHADGCGGGKRSECLDRLDPSDVVEALLGISE